jgi:dTDP-glucose pyrophosphorylase
LSPAIKGELDDQECLFLVAGYGTRFLPATKAQPKEMLPILTKPEIPDNPQATLNRWFGEE